MAVGDTVSDLVSIGTASPYLDIQPGAGTAWCIHNIYHEKDINLEKYDGTNSLTFDSDTGSGAYSKYSWHVTNSQRLRVENTATASQLIGYDGVITST